MSRGELLWPWWVRLTHWLVAAGVIALWLMSYVWYETDWLHRSVGYAVLAVMAGRMLGGSLTHMHSARFHLPRWHAVKAHVMEMRRRALMPHWGHNPLGQCAAYLIWLLILSLVFTGWLSRTDALWGEDWPVELHAALSFALLGFIVLHVIAVNYVGKLSRQHLVRQMWHGRFEQD